MSNMKSTASSTAGPIASSEAVSGSVTISK